MGPLHVFAVGTLGVSLLASKVEDYGCPDCGGKVRRASAFTSGAKRRQKGKEWRCAKNRHLLGRNYAACPIDGSPASWVDKA